MDYKVATAAANWWISQLKKRYKELYPDKVTGDESNLVVIDDSLKGELFRFEKAFLNYAKNESYASLTCCYLPNRNLAKLVDKADVSRNHLPIRAEMRFCGDHVEVSIDGNGLRKLPLSAKHL